MKVDANLFPKVLFDTTATPATPSAGSVAVYAKADGLLYYQGSDGTEHALSGSGSAAIPLGIACSDETTALTTGTAKATFRLPFAFTLSAVRASVTTAPTGATLTVDINQNGTSILSTKLTIDASEKTSTTAATAPVISTSALTDAAEITVDIDQIGSTIAGAGLKVWLIGAPA